ncbi:MAG: hypothetical protein ACXWCB_13205, partial [Acidimicrobiales bacterium]
MTTVSVPSLEMPPPTAEMQKVSPLIGELTGTGDGAPKIEKLHPVAVMPLRFPVTCVRLRVSVPEFMIPPPPVIDPQTGVLSHTTVPVASLLSTNVSLSWAAPPDRTTVAAGSSPAGRRGWPPG